MTCSPCTHAAAEGWWGPSLHGGTHCRGCHRSWSSVSQSHCTECHRHFGSNMAGDAHRRRDECVDPEGFDRWETPDGATWGGRDPVAAAARLARITPRGRAETAGKAD